MNGLIFFRADHELIGRVLAEKLRRRTDRDRLGDSFRVINPQPASASNLQRLQERQRVDFRSERGREEGRATGQSDRALRARNGSWWSDSEWLNCRDGKARRGKPGVRLLVDGLPGRVGLWRVAGNAISPVLAAEVLGALMDDLADSQRQSRTEKQTANKPSLSESVSENMSDDMATAAEK